MKHKLSPKRVKELEALGFMKEIEDPHLDWVMTVKNLRPCLWCGEIQPVDRDHFCPSSNGNFNYRCRECDRKRAKKRYASFTPEQKAKHIAYVTAYNKAHPEMVKAFEQKRKYTPQQKARRNLRRALKYFMQSSKKNFNKSIGCTCAELYEHLESQFKEGMSWENYGGTDPHKSWHIDHIIPLAKFKGKYPNHFTNLQPLWGWENLAKGNKLEGD
jgi:hypothetical protein